MVMTGAAPAQPDPPSAMAGTLDTVDMAGKNAMLFLIGI